MFNGEQSRPAKPVRVTPSTPDYEKQRPLFGWLPVDTIKRTYDLTTQYGRIPMSTILKKRYKAPNPALNVYRRDESVATDTFFSDTPAIDCGVTTAQFFVGCDSMVCDAYPMKSSKKFVNTLEDNIRERGAMNRLISDSARDEMSSKVKDILRTLLIGAWQSEAYHQHQNPSERRFQTVKTQTNRILDRTGAPPSTWLLCLLYVIFLLNHTFCNAINAVPIQRLRGSTPDISPLLCFHFWEEVYYRHDDSDFPSESTEGHGHFVGIAENVGHSMTFKILTSDTNKIIFRSSVRSAEKGDRNLRADMGRTKGKPHSHINDTNIEAPDSDDGDTSSLHNANGEMGSSNKYDDSTEPPSVLKSRHDQSDTMHPEPMPIFNPEDLVGRTFLLGEQKDGQNFRARIVEAINAHEDKVKENPELLRFKCSINNDAFEEIMAYNDIVNHIYQDQESDIVWKFKEIIGHEGPLSQSHPSYHGSKFNVKVRWENDEVTYEPLNALAADDPVSCAQYALKNNLLKTDGWRRFKSIAKNEKKMTRMVKQAKLRSYKYSPKYMFGFEVPRNYAHALELDKKNGNTKWKDSTDLEIEQLHDYKSFRDMGRGVKIPEGYKKIRTHLVYAVKHDGRHKARMVADGHLTDIPLDSVYSGVVSLRGLRLVIFLAELNDLETFATDIGNAYLEAHTKEKVCFIAGNEFGDLAGHLLIIDKALYGLRTSGLRWHDKFSDCLRDMGFQPSRSEPDIWMRLNKEHDVYEYIAVYVDDLAIAAKDCQPIIDTLANKYHFKLKGTGKIQYHLGMDFFRDNNDDLCVSPRRYIDKICDSFERMFGHPPKQVVTSPIEKNDHPELDTSELLDEDWTQKYQSLIGALQWVISIGRFDVQTSVMTLSSFRSAPRRGHLDRVKRIFGYLAKMKHAVIRIRTEEPDFSGLPTKEYDWEKTVYGDCKEVLPTDAPEPKGKFVTLFHYVDANLMHCLLTGRSVTGILSFINKTPVDWFSKKQSTVETATYGSELVAARIAVERMIDLRITLRYLGVPLREKDYMFGDNESVVNSSSIPYSKLHKRHNALSYHKVRETIASKMLSFHHIPGTINPADILSKHWGYSQIWETLQPILFWEGDTADLLVKKK